MAGDCPFCAIVAGDIPARVVAESDTAVAFLDANPLSPGHTLVVPRSHRERLNELAGSEASGVYELLHRVASAIPEAVDADGLTVGFNDGPAAGQEVPHVHGHIVPRFDEDGHGPLHALFEDRPDLADDELDDVAAAISDALGR